MPKTAYLRVEAQSFAVFVHNKGGLTMDKFALVIVGIVAIVGIVGLLNFYNATGNVITTGTNVMQSSSEKELYTTQWECEDSGNHRCSSFMAETTDPGYATDKFWQCGEMLCHRLFYRIS